MLFDRLYVLRNQLVHGGATWNSSVNRGQVKAGAEILAFLVPVFVDVDKHLATASISSCPYTILAYEICSNPLILLMP